MKLKIELIPQQCWGKNCRTLLSTKDWDILRKHIYLKNNYKCQICGDVGKRHPVECHEVWKYKKGRQKLIALEALCPMCHQAKHIGRAIQSENFKRVFKHFKKVNKITTAKAEVKIKKAFYKNSQRNINYKLNIKLAYRLLEALKEE